MRKKSTAALRGGHQSDWQHMSEGDRQPQATVRIHSLVGARSPVGSSRQCARHLRHRGHRNHLPSVRVVNVQPGTLLSGIGRRVNRSALRGAVGRDHLSEGGRPRMLRDGRLRLWRRMCRAARKQRMLNQLHSSQQPMCPCIFLSTWLRRPRLRSGHSSLSSLSLPRRRLNSWLLPRRE